MLYIIDNNMQDNNIILLSTEVEVTMVENMVAILGGDHWKILAVCPDVKIRNFAYNNIVRTFGQLLRAKGYHWMHKVQISELVSLAIKDQEIIDCMVAFIMATLLQPIE